MGVTLGTVAAFGVGVWLSGVDGVTFGGWLENAGLGAISNQFNWPEIASWRIAFVVIGAPGILVAMLMWTTVKEPPRGYSDAPETGGILKAGFVETLRELRSKPTFMWNTIAASLVAFVGYGFIYFQNIFLETVHGLSTGQASAQFGVPLALFAAVGTFSGGFLSDKLSRYSFSAVAWVPAVGLLISIPFYLLAVNSDDLNIAFFGWAVAAVMHYAYLGAQFNITQGIVNSRSRATAIAIMLIVVSVFGNGLGPQFVGIMGDVLSQKALGDGVALADCAAKAMPSDALQSICAEAKKVGIRGSFTLTILVFAFAAASFFMCCRHIRKDWVASEAV